MTHQESFTLERFHHASPSFQKFIAEVRGHEALARTLPSVISIQTYATTLRQLVQEGHVDIPTMDFSLVSKLTLCHQKGWVHATKVEFPDGYNNRYCMRYSFPSPLHRAYVSWYLIPTKVQLPRDCQIYDLTAEAIRRFRTPQVLECARNNENGQKDPASKTSYQDEFYHAIVDRFNGSVAITPEFASASGARIAGRMDFFIHQTKWGIECMRDGQRLLTHSEWFRDNESYEQWLKDSDMEDYILLDFRVSMPEEKHPGRTFIGDDYVTGVDFVSRLIF